MEQRLPKSRPTSLEGHNQFHVLKEAERAFLKNKSKRVDNKVEINISLCNTKYRRRLLLFFTNIEIESLNT